MKYDRQALKSQIEESKRSLPYYGEVLNFGWFFVMAEATDPSVLKYVYEEATEFAEEHIPDYLAAKYLKDGEAE